MKKELAEITDKVQALFPNGRGVLVYELKKPDFYSLKKEFDINETENKQFKIDISGVEVIFILDELLNA